MHIKLYAIYSASFFSLYIMVHIVSITHVFVQIKKVRKKYTPSITMLYIFVAFISILDMLFTALLPLLLQ
jgi:hypothetical protein